MPVDPNIVPLLDLLATVPPMSEGTPEEARAAFRQLTVAARQPDQVVPVWSVENTTIPGLAGDLRARVPPGAGRAGADGRAVPRQRLGHR